MRSFAASLLAFVIATTALAQRVALLRIEGFPTADAPAISHAVLDEALAALSVDRLSSLENLPHDVLVLPYGSAFPVNEWAHIRAFVRRGGSLVVLGGAPFHQPVPGNRTPKFARELLIGPAEEIVVDPSWKPDIGAKRTWALTIRLATKPEFPNEHGSEGPREGFVRALQHLVDVDGIPRAAPVVEIERERSRWIFATSDATLRATEIRNLVQRALTPVARIEARPVRATVMPGEKPQIRVTNGAPASAGAVPAKAGAPFRATELIVRNDAGRVVQRRRVNAGVVELNAFPPGLYHVNIGDKTTGFWVRDEKLLKSGPKITVSRDWLRRNGRVFPVNGTTYMSSEVHRQFLFEPNPHVWDRDFAQMSRLGINFVRTGIWTGWSKIDDTFLSALEAYVLSAAKHDIVVNFTFYAFLPLAHGGTNPYLDPKSLAGQKEWLTAVAKHFRGVGWIHYDLINEPSYSPPNRLWSNTPIGDEWEKRAFKGGNFVEFSNAAVAGWARELRAAIRDAGGDVLVTLGQDEGGTWHRPSQQLHADAVDYTCIHPWWQNDDVLANGVYVKVPEKASLFQEVGLMRLEDPEGWPWRSPEVASSLLERKYGYGFAARSAGVIEWAWNINPYMPIDNESVIGFFRPDGTAKPELQIVPKLAAFFRTANSWLDDFEPDEVIVVIPQKRLFENRPNALDGYRRLIRVLAERFGIVPTAISDLRLTPERLHHAKLIIAPSLEFRSDVLDSFPNVLYLGAYGDGRPVQFREDGVTFDRSLQESLLRGATLPLEYAREEEPLVDLLTRSLAAAGVTTHRSDTRVAARLLYAPRAILGIFVNDDTRDLQRRVTVAGRAIDIPVRAGRMRLVLFERETGRIIAETSP